MITAAEFLKWCEVFDIKIGSSKTGVTPKQVQTFFFNFDDAAGVDDAFVVNLDPPVTEFTDGMPIFLSTGALKNTVSNPTLKVNNMPIKYIEWGDGGSLFPDDISPNMVYILIYNADTDAFQIINPTISEAKTGNIQNNLYTSFVDSGVPDAYEGELYPAGVNNFTDGMTLTMLASNTNTGASTLDLHGEVNSIKMQGGTELSAGMIVAGRIYQLAFAYQEQEWILLNPTINYTYLESVTGTANQIDIDNTDPQNPVASLSNNLIMPGKIGADIDIDNHQIKNLPLPISGDNAATKGYVDGLVLNIIPACNYAATANLAGYTYDNGTSGVGATLTAGSDGAFSADGQTPALNDRIFLYLQTNAAENGIYVLTQTGDGSNPAILTRATDYDQASQMQAGDEVRVVGGDTLSATKWMMTQTAAITVGTTDITWDMVSIPDNLVTTDTTQTISGAKTFTSPLDLISSYVIAGNNRNNNTNKSYYNLLPNYENALGYFPCIGMSSTVSGNIINIGGGSSLFNACTIIRFFAASGLDTKIGTIVANITANGIALTAGVRVNAILSDATLAGASNTNVYTGLAIKNYIASALSSYVQSLTGTTNEIDIDNTDSQNPIAKLSSTLVAPGTVRVGNLLLNGNTISSQDTNGHINITPNGSGYVAIGGGEPRALFDVQGIYAVFGNLGDGESKSFRQFIQNYNDSDGLFCYIYAVSNSTDNHVIIGGGTSGGNAATQINLYCAANHTTTTGTSVGDITIDGLRLGNDNARVSTIIDDDSMSTASDTTLSTSESIKAYVDSKTELWSEVTGTSQTMVAGGGYITNNAGLVTLTLPSTAAIGTKLSIVGKGAGGWLVAQGSGQSIQIGSVASTTGASGSIASSNQFDSLVLVCTAANTTWTILGAAQSAGIVIN